MNLSNDAVYIELTAGSRDDLTILRPSRAYECRLLSLRDVYIDFDSHHPVAALFEWLRGAPLRNIACPGAGLLGQLQLPSDAAEPAYRDHISDIVSMFISTIDQLRLLHAWGMPPNLLPELQDLWGDAFAPRELVLGTKSPVFYEFGHRRLSAWASISIFKQNVFSYLNPDNFTHWGTAIERMRIDQIHLLPDMRFDGLDHVSCRSLRILMLHPWPLYDPHKAHQRATHPDFTSSPIYKLACQFAALGPPTLRVLALFECRFWLEREDTHDFNDDGTGSGRLPPPSANYIDIVRSDATNEVIRMWHWKDAKLDKWQAKAMAHHLSGQDLNFLDHIPSYTYEPLHVAISKADRVGYPNQWRTPLTQMIRHRNYVTVKREIDGRPGTEEWRHRPKMHEREITEWNKWLEWEEP